MLLQLEVMSQTYILITPCIMLAAAGGHVTDRHSDHALLIHITFAAVGGHVTDRHPEHNILTYTKVVQPGSAGGHDTHSQITPY